MRVYKTRSLATLQCKQDKVRMNEEPVKPSRNVKPGEFIEVRKGAVSFTFLVVAIPKNRVGAKLVPDYMEDRTSEDQLEKLEAIRLANQNERLRGLGRPTKKDRRDIDRYFQ